LLWISSFLALLLLYLLLNWLPTLLVTDGLSHAQASAAQFGFNLCGAIAAVSMGYTLAGRRRAPAVILTFVALPILLAALARAPANVAMIMVLVSCLGCSVIAAQAFLYATAPVIYPTSIRGVGVGLSVAMGRVGSIVGPKLGGYLKSAGHGPSQLLTDLLPLVVLGSVCALLLAWRSLRD
jgi:AAHS family 3-hydroxyphenylpropionic acid transporter